MMVEVAEVRTYVDHLGISSLPFVLDVFRRRARVKTLGRQQSLKTVWDAL
jgi:hypothetical protein